MFALYLYFYIKPKKEGNFNATIYKPFVIFTACLSPGNNF